MFGSKLRSWMENHIVRSRKKGNKNKNALAEQQTVATGATTTTSNDHKHKHAATGFTIYHHHHQQQQGNGSCSSPYKSNSNSQASSSANHTGCSSVISSPVRRREVSPIQNHTQSRYGWQSPDGEHVMSPKSDNFLYAPQHHSQQYLRNHHTAPNTRENSCEEKPYQPPPSLVPNSHQHQLQPQSQQQQHQLNCSTSSFSSLSWSTGSKEPSMHSNNNNNGQLNSANLSVLTDVTNANVERHPSSYTPPDETKKYEDDDPNTVHYEEIGTLIRHPEKLLQDILNDIERPKSEQFVNGGQRIPAFSDEKQTQDDASTRYGRLLPSKIPNPTVIGFRTGSEECIPRNGSNTAVQMGQGRNGGSRSKFRGGNAPMVSLSSPESAYSTGYSTDGTSPGAGYTPPEYYVNMRTGTHYFPKSVNSLAIEAQRYKFGLNKIEEMSPIDPLPKTSFAHRNLEETESGLVKHPHSLDPYEKILHQQHPLPYGGASGQHSPLPIRNTIVIPTLKGFESPSPRQRSRIRTNPWYSTTETSSSGSTMQPQQQQVSQLNDGNLMNISQISSSMTMSSSTSSHSTSALSTIHLQEQDFQHRTSLPSGIVSSSSRHFNSGSASGSSRGNTLSMKTIHNNSSNSNTNKSNSSSGNNNNNNNNLTCVSSGSSSSLTEVENAHRPYTPNTVRRKRSLQLHQHHHNYQTHSHPVEPVAAVSLASPHKKPPEAPLAIVSDDDNTLNEMMGKFDESYIYEKETDILSDSDPTDCPTDLDTGQDAGDECDTDDLLDIDFIDTASVQEIFDRRDQINMGACYYGSPVMAQRHQRAPSTRSRRSNRSIKVSGEQNLMNAAAGSAQRRRKRFHKTRKKSSEGKDNCRSPMRKPRETRSVGGTPVCLRKNARSNDAHRYSQTTPHQLSHRSSSLVFTDVRESRFMTIAESEKALLRADFEADVKYKQLIMEAESILQSMRNSVQSIPRETPQPSPRRINPLANKRVEMIKNCEIDLQKQQQQAQQAKNKTCDLTEQELTAAVNKRIEMLKLETQSPPGSPKLGACSPRKTHLTNFINQNIAPETGMRKQLNSPLVQRRNLSPSASPLQQRRLTAPAGIIAKAQSLNAHSHQLSSQWSDSDQDYSAMKINDQLNQNYLQATVYQEASNEYNDARNHNNIIQQATNMGPKITLNYCPQSEPLKRKVYKSHSTFDNNKLRHSAAQREEQLKHQRLKAYNTGSGDFALQQHGNTKLSSHDLQHFSSHSGNGLKTDFHSTTNVAHTSANQPTAGSTDKAALIQRTLADLKRNLEHQSLELNGLNEV